MRAFLEDLRRHPALGPRIAHERRIPGRRARYAEPDAGLNPALRSALEAQGIERLYLHQARALDASRSGKNVLAVTPTASGKTLVFALPVLERILAEPSARALFLYPTKALAQDQIQALRDLASGTGGIRPPRFAIYDGDTPDGERRKIKGDPPEVLITNPDMLHMGILAHHADWGRFLGALRVVVLDELHVYRGIFGAHVHHILARLKRLAALHGSTPKFIAASATIGNPAEFARTLTGETFEVVGESGAPAAARQVVIVNPGNVSPYTLAVKVVAEAARRDLRTIAFTKARRVAELLHTWLAKEAPELRRKVAPYRAGYLPEERRALERRLFGGELMAVFSTSALELGIDVGGLDVCVLVGYPGSMTSTWQRIGRVGRQGRDALVVLVAMPDALDQYLVAHPDLFFAEAFERAVLDPWNPMVAGAHLVCAAAEEPLRVDEIEGTPAATAVARGLESEGRLRLDATGDRWHSFRRRPQRDVHPRSAGAPYAIVASGGRLLGTIDAMRVHSECHPGAIYLHGGQSFLIRKLDSEALRVEAEPIAADYYTVVLGEKETEILERIDGRALSGRGASFPAGLGRLRVTVRIREYQKKRLFGGEPISTHPLETPPLVFETVGFWVEIPNALPESFAAEGLHFMGGIHAAEHASIALFPLLAIADRSDIGGISYVRHPQLDAPAIFVYDGVPGGAGLAAQGYRDLETLLGRTRELVGSCSCEEGCPACIQSPKCGNGNKPLDKAAALRVLDVLLGDAPVPPGVEPRAAPPALAPPPSRKHGITRAGGLPPSTPVPDPALVPEAPPGPARTNGRVLVFDLETQRSAAEVGGWDRASEMRVALAVVWDARAQAYRTYYEADVDRLLLDLALADRVVGFNIERFDLAVLSGYTDRDLRAIRTLDLLEEIHRRLGFRVSLAHLAEANLGESKAGDGLQSLAWWKEGRIDLIEQYCRKDVEVTRRLWELGAERGYLVYRDKRGNAMRVQVAW